MLRPDQSAVGDAILSHAAAGRHRIAVQAPTAWGKGVLAADILARCEARGTPALFVSHLEEINLDTAQRIRAAGVSRVAVVMGDHATGDPGALITVASIQTLARRGARPPAKVIIIDEAHRVRSSSYEGFAKDYPEALFIGLTATPERGDGAPLSFFEVLIPGPSPSSLVAAGIIAPIDTFAPAEFVEALADDPVERWPIGRPGIVFASNRPHSRAIVEGLGRRGIIAAHVDGATHDRDTIVSRFNAGEIDVLSCYRIFVEGVNAPRAEVCMLAGAVTHVGAMLQMVGRVRRVAPGKSRALLLDLRGNVHRLGLPDDERTYHLEGKAIRLREKESLPAITCCKNCLSWLRPFSTCPECGAVAPPPKPPRLSKRELQLIRQASAPRDGEDWELWVRLVLEGRRKGWKPQAASLKFKSLTGRFPRWGVAQVPSEDEEKESA